MNGCDVSSYQGTIDFDALATALPGGFVIAKATEGTSFVDREFARNWSEAKRVGLRRGAYHFAVPDLGSSAQDEARHFLSALGPLDASDMLMLDYERDWTGDVVGWCRQWLELVRSVTGITPDIYLNLYLSHVYDWGTIEQPGGFPLWLADYDGEPDKVIETPWPRVAIKQWTSSGRLAGIVGMVDLNVMKEDPAVNTPVYAGQSVADVNIKVGEVAMVSGIWTYADKGQRTIEAKVYGTTPGIFPLALYPPADPDADPTLVLNTQPALFIVAIRPA